MPEGQIIKALSGYYYVREHGEDEIWQCRARGVFKNIGIHPLVGDYVHFEPSTVNEGTIVEVLPRNNELLRPPIANIDQALVIFSIEEPAFSALLLDKFLINMEKAGIETLICLTKIDLAFTDQQSSMEMDLSFLYQQYPEIKAYQQIGYHVLATSSRDKLGLTELKNLLQGKTTVLAGQSGVGKSSLLNAIDPNLQLETQDISSRLGRGKHTTRHVEIIPLPYGGGLADTPGFSQLDFPDMEPEELGAYFREFNNYSPSCKFRGCLHQNEPACAVKNALEKEQIAPHRYQNYLQFLEELQLEKQRKRY